MLIERYELEVFTPPCFPGAARFSAIARLETDLSEALPYLNATIEDAMYNPAAGALSWKHDKHAVVLGPHQIAVGNLEDRVEAKQLVDRVIDVVNQTWQQRHEITPDHTPYQRPTPIQVYNLLPKTNCKACGEPTCYNFALKLIATQATLESCPVLLEPDHVAQHAELQTILPGMFSAG